MRDNLWTPARVEQCLRHALVTLRRIPSKNLFPAGIRVAWPDVVSSWESYGWDKTAKPRVQATAADIQDMDRTLAWVWTWLHPSACQAAQLAEDAGAIVLMRASGLAWEEIGEYRLERWQAPKAARVPIPGGNSFPSLRKIHRGAIGLVVTRLGGDPTRAPAPVRPQDADVWDVGVILSRPGAEIGESPNTGGKIHARASWGVRRRGGGGD